MVHFGKQDQNPSANAQHQQKKQYIQRWKVKILKNCIKRKKIKD